MSWRDRLLRVTINGRKLIGGSYDGATFFVDSHEVESGRRIISHEIPYSEDDPYNEDTGKLPLSGTIEVYCLGENYDQQKKALIAALDRKGPRELVHPYVGKFKASVGPYRYRETKSNGGKVTFSIQYVRAATAPKMPSQKIDAAKNVKNLSRKALANARSRFGSNFDTTVVSSDFLAPAEAVIRAAGTNMQTPFGVLLTNAQELARMRQRMNNLVNNAAALVSDPFGSFDAILDCLEFAFAPPKLPAFFADMLRSGDSDDSVLPKPPAQTASRIAEADLYLKQKKVLKKICVLRTAEIAAEAQFEVYQDAVAVREQLRDELEQIILEAADEEYQALEDLRVAVLQSIPPIGQQLSEVTIHTPVASTQSISLAYRLYGTTSREQEIVDLNNCKNPGFLVADAPLKVRLG